MVIMIVVAIIFVFCHTLIIIGMSDSIHELSQEVNRLKECETAWYRTNTELNHLKARVLAMEFAHDSVIEDLTKLAGGEDD